MVSLPLRIMSPAASATLLRVTRTSSKSGEEAMGRDIVQRAFPLGCSLVRPRGDMGDKGLNAHCIRAWSRLELFRIDMNTSRCHVVMAELSQYLPCLPKLKGAILRSCNSRKSSRESFRSAFPGVISSPRTSPILPIQVTPEPLSPYPSDPYFLGIVFPPSFPIPASLKTYFQCIHADLHSDLQEI